MSDFDAAIAITLKNEGGFVNKANDPGGPTNFGISLRFLQQNNIDVNYDGVIDIEDVLSLNKTSAINIYKKYFWDKNNYGLIKNQLIAEKIFDICVVHGEARVNAIAQTCLVAQGCNVVIDGIFGPKTIEALNFVLGSELYLKILKAALASSLAGLGVIRAGSKEYIKGWVARALR